MAITRELIGAMLARGGGRMRDHDGAALLATMGLPLAADDVSTAPAAPIVGPHPGAFGVGAGLRALDAQTLTELADLAETRGNGELQLTPWRCVLLPGVTELSTNNPALIGDAGDPLLSVAACVGSPACARASVSTRRDALRLARHARGGLHVSGCAKGCAQATAAAVTLVGGDGRYDLVWNGRADCRARSSRAVDRRCRGPAAMTAFDYEHDGGAIYRRSFATIRAEARLARFTPAEARVAVRVIMPAGWWEIADDLVFSLGFAEVARAALLAEGRFCAMRRWSRMASPCRACPPATR